MQNNSYSASLLIFESKEVNDELANQKNMTLPNLNSTGKRIGLENASKFHPNLLNPSVTTMKMNTKYGNIKTAMDALEQIQEFEEKANEGTIQHEDIFKKKKYHTTETDPGSSISSLDEINRFNSSIIKNIQWGVDTGRRQKMEISEKKIIKPDLKEIEAELGNITSNFKLNNNIHLNRQDNFKY